MVSGIGTGIKFTKSGIFSVLNQYRLLTFSVSVRHQHSPVFTLKYRYGTSTDRDRTIPY
ncbi:hypothetical protein HanRHA438_Chr02g0084841 [Helianthus annuus]|nr:hypothetical protein HanRHA438_Chr02g0084841 [Helianthus annuus]